MLEFPQLFFLCLGTEADFRFTKCSFLGFLVYLGGLNTKKSFFFYLGPSQKQVCFQANFFTACFVVIILKLSKPKQTGLHFGCFEKLIVDHNFIQS